MEKLTVSIGIKSSYLTDENDIQFLRDAFEISRVRANNIIGALEAVARKPCHKAEARIIVTLNYRQLARYIAIRYTRKGIYPDWLYAKVLDFIEDCPQEPDIIELRPGLRTC